MKVKPKKNVEIPAEIRTFTERVLLTPFENLHEVLNGFTWKYEKGDFHHWIPLINYFDAFLEKYIRHRADLVFKMHASETDPPFPTQSTLAVLNVTTMILENCTNKHLYQSYEHLTDLLAAPDSDVLICTLLALVAFLKKTHHSSVRFHGYPALNTRLFDLCRGWGGTEQGLEMVACVQENEGPIQEFLKKGTTLHFEFYSDNSNSTNTTNAGLRVIHEEHLDQHYSHLTDHQILEELVKQFSVPIGIRFRLLNHIRIARGFGSLEGRRSLVKIRLLAFCVLFQSNPLHDDMLSFFMAEPEFMNELVGLLQAEFGVSLELRTLALRALTVQLVDRSRHTAVINAIGIGGQNGVLSILLQDSIDYVCSQDIPQSSSQQTAKYDSPFVEALLVLVAALISSSAGSVALSESGLIPALLPLLRDRNPTQAGLVSGAVKILEGFMAFSSTASALLRGLGGLTAMINRLEAEVQWGTSPADSNPGPSTHQEAKRMKSQDEESKQVPYGRRLLLKSLLRAIALASYAPSVGNGTRPDDQDARTLYQCLKSIFIRAKEFGGALFAFAASVATDLIHHDPFCFNALDEVGVPDAFLDAILIEGVLPSSEAVCGIPPTLVAFCLTENGLKKVKDRHALSCMTVIFTSKKYLRALSGDTASILGAGTDELFRHVRSLKEEGIQHVIVQTLKALCLLGGDPELLEEYKDPTEQIQNPVEAELNEDVEMTDVEETLSSSQDAMEVIEEQDSTPVILEMPFEVLERSKETGIDSTLPECISHAAKMLESLLSSADTSQKFVQCRGVEYLLRLYKLPRMPPAFGSSSQSHSLLSIFRSLSHEHYQCLSANVPVALSTQLEATTVEAEKLHTVCVPALDAERRDGYVRLIASTSGLTSVAGTIARTSNPMLTELCKGDKNLISLLGNLERLVLHQLSHSDLWKERKSRFRKEVESAQDTSSTTGVEATAEESEAERTDLEMSAMEVDSEFVGGAANEQSSNPTWQNEIEMQNLTNGKYSRRKSPDDLAFDVLQHFVVTVRGLYTAIAKSIHTPARRREESFEQPSLTMKAAALGLALVLKHNLEFEISDLKELGFRYIKHQNRLIEEVQMVLFDNRRQCCHTLILNYFVAVQGMASLLNTFSQVMNLLWSLIHEANDQPCSSNSGGGIEITQNESKQAVESLLLAFLGLFTQLTSPRLLCQSAPTASLLVVPLPAKESSSSDQDEEQSTRSKEFIKKLQESILEAVLPLWSSPNIAKTTPAITSNVIGILNSCLDGETNLSAAFRAIRTEAGAGGNHWRQPDPSMVQQIIDMGFTRARAVQALRRNVLNSVEAALDWLVNHPEEDTNQTPNEGASRGENVELEAAMAASLDQICDGGPSSSTGVDLQKTESLQCLDLVIGAVSVLERMPVAAFSVSSLLMTLCSRNEGVDRRSVIQWFVQNLKESLLGSSPYQKDRNYSRMNATAHLLALMMSESQPCRQVAVELKITDDLVSVLEAWERQYDGKSEIPVWIEGVLLVLDFLAQTHQPSNSENTMSNQTPEAEGQSDEESMEAEISDKLQKIMEVWTPSGSITEPQRFILMEFCVKLLSHLQTYGKEWTPVEASENPAVNPLANTDPAGVTQAVLQLLSSITRCHPTASKFLHQGGVDLILTLPAACILPRHESYISTILMHILEDESTLLSLMETEIKHVFSTQRRPVEQIPLFEWEQMRIGSFLQKTSSLAYRSPKIYAKAVAGLCTIGPSGTGLGNQVIFLKRSKNQPKSTNPAVSGSSTGATTTEKTSISVSESKGKANKRVVLMSFVEVIDKLLDHVMSFDLTANSMITDKDQDPSAKGVTSTDPSINGNEDWEAMERLFESVYRAGQTEDSTTMRPSGTESFTGPLSRQSIMNNRDLIMQIMVLRMLSDFCLLYSSTIGVLLKRDAELSQKDPPILTEMHSGLLKRVLHGHLSWSLKSDLIKPNLSEEASRFLQAVCVRSSEGRRRVLTEIVVVLNWATGLCPKAPKQANLGMPFVSVIGAPSGSKIKALISLIGSLLTSGSPSKPANQNAGGANGANGANQSPPPTTGLTVELIRTMRSVGMVSALTKSLDLIDIHHPESPKAINSIIKALEILTRVIPLANPKKSTTQTTPDRERSTEGQDIAMVVSSSPPTSTPMPQPPHMQSADLMEEDLNEIEDAAQLFYEALENINEMEEGSSEDIMQSNEDDPMDASEDDEDDDSESGTSNSSSESNSFHEDASHEDHVVVDEESEDIEDEHEELEGSGDDEDLDEEDEDMEEGEEDEDGSADMELEDGEDWEDDEVMREYTETLDRIDSVVWGAADDPPELLNTLNESGIVFSRNERGVPPHIRSVLENMLGNFVGNRDENHRQDRRGGIRFRLLPREQNQAANAPPPYRVQPQGAAEHRLLARPPNESSGPQTGNAARNMAEGFGRRYGQVVGTGGNWRRHIGYAGLPSELLRNPLGEAGGIHPHHHGAGGNEVANAFGERRGRDNTQQGGPDIGSTWMNSMQGQFEDLLVNTLPREAPAAAQQPQQQPETSTPVQGAPLPSNVGQMDAESAPVEAQETGQETEQEVQTNQSVEQQQQQPSQEVVVPQQQDEAVEEENDDGAMSEDSDEDEAMEEDDVPVVEQEQNQQQDQQQVQIQEQEDQQDQREEQENQQDQEQDQTQEQGENQEQEEEQEEEALPPEILQCAEQVGIDPAFLQALPRPLQIEVLTEHGVSISQLVSQDQNQQQQQQQGQQEGEEGGGDGVDPEFLAALPPDIREEVLESQRLEERRREVERRLVEGHGDDVANVIASLPDDIREEVLLYGGPDILYNLPPNLLAEGQRMRERNVRHHHRDNEDEQLSPNLFIRRLRQEAGLHRDGPTTGTGINRFRGKKDKKEEMEIPPAVDVNGLASLVGLLRLNQPIIKGQLQRLFLNLCYREDNRKEITQLLLQKLKESDQSTTSIAANAPSPSVTRRVLDLLSYLARYPASKVAEMMLELRVRTSELEIEKNGKLPLHESSLNPRAFEVLMEMLNQPLCLRSVSTLEQGLLLMEAVLQCASLKKKEVENTEENQGGTSNKMEDIESLQSLSFDQLRSLPGILARDGLSERAYKKTDSVVSLLVESAPKHLVPMLLALKTQIEDLMHSACSTLSQISSNGFNRSSIYALGGIGALILRVLHTVESLVEITTEDEEERVQDLLRTLSSSLDILWKELSPLISTIESQILSTGETTVTGMERDASSKVLPSGASQTLPFIESFFVLCSALKFFTRNRVLEEESLARQSGSEQALVSSSSDILQSPATSVPSPNDSMLQDFVEKHRLLLNAFIRQTPALLEGSFKPLIQTPRLIDFDNKRLYFRNNVRVEDRMHYGTLRINVRREHVFEDSFYQLRHRSAEELRWKLSVQFAGEEGIDAGGVAREWYQVMSKEIFNPNLALFIAVPDGASTFQPNPNSTIQNDRGVNHLDFFRFVGRLVGKALYDGQLVDAHFTRSFYKHMLNQALTYQDLEAVDLDFYKQMKWILENDITEVLVGQTFSAEMDFFGRKEVVELKESGSKINITENNKREYVNLMTKHKMTTAIRDQIKAFQEGFWELIPMDLINIFNDHELELIISGLPEVDISDLKANTEYTGYTAASPAIQWFWNVVEELDKENLALLLQFVTGTSKIPLDGFAHLQGISGPQKFQIHKSYVSTNRLPSAHTCFNQLDLPEYETKDQLKDRLLLAIHEGCEGFGFG